MMRLYFWAKLAIFALIMKLFADIGNSFVKASVSDGLRQRLVYQGPSALGPIRDSLCGLDIDGGMWCSVRPIGDDLLSFFCSLCMTRLTLDTPVPIRNMYKTPSTLGMDRLAAAVGAWSIKKGYNLFVVDAGTAITFDMVTMDGDYIGGNIAPGIELRFKALHEHTGALPLVGRDGETPLFGRNTEEAIRSGVIRGVCNELNGYVAKLRHDYKPLFVFLTGGDADCFEMNAKSGTFVVPNLVLMGLESIFSYNEKGLSD